MSVLLFVHRTSADHLTWSIQRWSTSQDRHSASHSRDPPAPVHGLHAGTRSLMSRRFLQVNDLIDSTPPQGASWAGGFLQVNDLIDSTPPQGASWAGPYFHPSTFLQVNDLIDSTPAQGASWAGGFFRSMTLLTPPHHKEPHEQEVSSGQWPYWLHPTTRSLVSRRFLQVNDLIDSTPPQGASWAGGFFRSMTLLTPPHHKEPHEQEVSSGQWPYWLHPSTRSLMSRRFLQVNDLIDSTPPQGASWAGGFFRSNDLIDSTPPQGASWAGGFFRSMTLLTPPQHKEPHEQEVSSGQWTF